MIDGGGKGRKVDRTSGRIQISLQVLEATPAMIVGREVGGGVTLFFWQRLWSGTTNKKQITK